MVGTIDAARARAVSDLVDELAGVPSLHRISLDLTCSELADRPAAAVVEALLGAAGPSLDVATPGPLAWWRPHRHAA